MLNADRVALQSRVVQQLAAVKQQEIEYLLRRYGSLGLMAAFLTEISMEMLLEIPAYDEKVSPVLRTLFYTVSLFCVLANMWVILCTLLIGNWAPGLALRGPTGSLNRVFDALVSERRQINVAFVSAIFSFAIQMGLAVWCKEDTNADDIEDLMPDGTYLVRNQTNEIELEGFGIATSTQLALGIGFAVWYIRGMSRYFHSTDAARDLASGKVAGTEMPSGVPGPLPRGASHPVQPVAYSKARRRMSMLDNPVVDAVNSRGADVSLGPTSYALTSAYSEGTAWRPQAATLHEEGPSHVSASLELSGLLWKKQASEHSTGRSWLHGLRRARKASQELLMGPWHQRFFVMKEGELSYWHTEQDYAQGKPASEVIRLRGYEVLVNTVDARWGFELRPTLEVGQRTWWFRAASEDERLEWAQRLVAATFMR